MEGTGSEQGFRLLRIISFIGAIVFAVILLCVSAATIGIIENNDDLDRFRKAAGDGYVIVIGDAKDLLNLINDSLRAASWLIAEAIGVIIAVIIATVTAIVNIQPTVKHVFAIIKILFSAGVTVSYFATGIACAVYASQWGKKPVLCAEADQLAENEDDICDSIPLTATNALEAVFCFIQVGVFGLITGVIIFNLWKSRKQTT